ncbi:MAG TPA: transglycosylase domain-containing protein [Actinomycetota bacterium]|nr:transglycosylase domain-containing protein [Actinomycetota bacterium]
MATTPQQHEHDPGRSSGGRVLPGRAFRRWGPLWWLNVLGAVALALVAADFAVEYSLAKVPLPPEVKLPSTSEIYDRDGRLIATYRDEVTRFIIDTTRLPRHIREAVIAAEDRDFFEHEGISPAGMVRAAWANFTSGEVEQGGSTITQQYIKNAVLEDPSRTVERKVNEAILAIKLERRYSKEEILDFYLNTVYFGRGAYGIQAAAGVYFAKDAKQLTLDEAAYLAGLIPAPAAYQKKEEGLERRAQVLSAMREEGYISDAERERAANSKLRFDTSKPLRARRQPAAYFLEWLRKDFLYPHFGDCLYRCGLKIHTTIDLEMQREAEEAIASVLNEEGDPEAALVSLTAGGEVRAMVGGRDFTSVKSARGFNFATDGRRQAGSAFKPFTLLRAYEEGISPSSRFSGESPKTIEDPTCTGPDGIWQPENYEGSAYGTLDLTQATANSVNTVYAELVTEVGAADVADLVERFGFAGDTGNGDIPPHCSLSLGTLDVSVLEMARAYAGFAGRGALPRISPVTWVEGQSGRCLLGYTPPAKTRCKDTVNTEPKQVIDPNAVDVLTQTLEGVVEFGTGTDAAIGRPMAGKTGTTQDNRDAWFAGYTPQLATVVWMGYPIERGPDGKKGTADDVSPLMNYCGVPTSCRPVHGIDVTGGSFPAAIWSAFMAAALEGVDIEYFQTPLEMPGIVINPPPPPPPPEPEKGEKGDKEGEGGKDEADGGGNGNGGNKGPGGGDD